MEARTPKFTVFIPTYNRARLLPRALKSVDAQSYRDFEVVIVDDGSTDETEALVARWADQATCPVNYTKQTNQGKHVAHNTGVEAARGELFVVLDSDDRLLPDSLERMLGHWESIPPVERAHFAGVEGLVQSMDGQRILTKPYPRSPLDASFLETYYRMDIGGDKKHAVRTEILRRFRYPVFEGERHVRPDVTWKRFAHEYVFRCVNDVFQQVEYQPDGLSSNRFRLRMNNPRGFQLFCLEDLTLHRDWLAPRLRLRRTIDFIRYSLHSGQGVSAQGRAIGFGALWVLLLPIGVGRWLVDLYRLRIRRGKHRDKVALPR
jgi:glycosyltransferase involved in cell wall biosynthesis